MEKTAKPSLRHSQLFCCGAQIGAAACFHKSIIVFCLGQQRLPLRIVLEVLREGFVQSFHQGVQHFRMLDEQLELFVGDVHAIFTNNGDNLMCNPAFERFCLRLTRAKNQSIEARFIDGIDR